MSGPDNTAVVDGVRRTLHTVSETWYECTHGRHELCKRTNEYEATNITTNQPVLVVQVCDCICHNRAMWGKR